jgi:CBS domain-containing protein
MRTDDRAFAVVDDVGRFLGLATFADVRRTPRTLWNATRVSDVMTPRDRLVTTSAGEDLAEALEKLTRAGVDQLPVLDGDHLVGMLRRGDISKWLELHGRPHAQRYAH